jgi:hypothetical protein
LRSSRIKWRARARSAYVVLAIQPA